MDNEYTVISINGIDYYIQSNQVRNLNYIDNKLVNVSNSNITLVNSFGYDTTYPRITCSPMSQCILRNNYNSYSLVSSNYSYTKFNFNMLTVSNHLSLIFMILFILLGVKLWKK